jgi:hypothetical protein
VVLPEGPSGVFVCALHNSTYPWTFLWNFNTDRLVALLIRIQFFTITFKVLCLQWSAATGQEAIPFERGVPGRGNRQGLTKVQPVEKLWHSAVSGKRGKRFVKGPADVWKKPKAWEDEEKTWCWCYLSSVPLGSGWQSWCVWIRTHTRNHRSIQFCKVKQIHKLGEPCGRLFERGMCFRVFS